MHPEAMSAAGPATPSIERGGAWGDALAAGTWRPTHAGPPRSVLHLCTGNIYGGVETFLRVLAERDRPLGGVRNEFLVLFHGRLENELRAAGVRVHFLPGPRLSRPWEVWRFRRGFRQLVTENRFHLAVAHSGWSQQILGPELVRARLPFLTWIHSIDQGRPWLERRARRWTPAQLVLNSRYMDELTAGWYPGVARELQYYPVTPPPPVPAEARSRLRQELGVAPDQVVVVTACRLEPWKGHAVLLAALARLVKNPRWHCWIAGGAQRPGEANHLQQLRDFAEQAGIASRVQFLGQRNDVPVLLAAADIHCQPNQEPEPFGIAYVEALYAGLPVVSTRLGGALEIVTEATGRLVPPLDPAALADALGALIDDPATRRKLGQAGPARAAELCHPDHRVAALFALFRRLSSIGDPSAQPSFGVNSLPGT